ncbi:UDP-N-acetylmuramate dehydrogenase [uncultured Robinsoniella sp.]|uniref:UDP-N-acetylmuramate dehydrogenase n=1 Tax=uncultured Robinsoniella sp. TaxID=904190 RepID=UPI00374EF1FA
MNQDLYNQLCEIVGSDNVHVDEEMKKHTTFRIGGPADFYVLPHSKDEIGRVVQVCKNAEEPFYVLGNGSNLLVGDKGYRGVIIQIFKNYSDIIIEGTQITAKSGALLSKVAKKALDAGLTGFEFASGIPGTIGGAVVMNAGAYGGEMKDVILSATVMTREGGIQKLSNQELQLGYRTSLVARENDIVLEVRLGLKKGNSDEIRDLMEELKNKRVTKQPLEYPSAGSTFKRPEGYFAGKLIMDAGMRGFSVGDAQVSEKHCGFVINKGDASARDIVALMEEVTGRVKEQFGVTLEPEVKRLGEF